MRGKSKTNQDSTCQCEDVVAGRKVLGGGDLAKALEEEGRGHGSGPLHSQLLVT